MKISIALIASLAGVVSAAVADPQATPAAKRQDLGGILDQYSDLLTNSAFQSIAQSLEQTPDFLSAASAAFTSNYAPLESIASSLATDKAASSAIVSALGSSSAAALYSSASDVIESVSSVTNSRSEGATATGNGSGGTNQGGSTGTSSEGNGNGASLALTPQVASVLAVVGAAAAAFIIV
ncbi:unnamed protein product [Sympodiomycopsis kandeliae]